MISTTAHIKKVFGSGQPSLKLNERDGGEGKDPVARKPKRTTLIYTIGGEKKKRMFPEGCELKFWEDLN